MFLCIDYFQIYFFSLKIDSQYLNKVLSKCSNIFGFFRIYEQIFEYIRSSKNLQMNIQICSYWGNSTNTSTNNIRGPFYSNSQILEYLCSSLLCKYCLTQTVWQCIFQTVVHVRCNQFVGSTHSFAKLCLNITQLMKMKITALVTT